MKVLTVPSSGSIGGTTNSHNRAGQYVRSRRTPTQPQGTGRRAAIRTAFASASSAWASQTPDVQQAWQAYADAYPVTDALGQSIKLTGHQMFVSINVQLLNVGWTLQNAVPASNAVGPAGLPNCTAVAGGAFTVQLPGLGADADWQVLSVSGPQSGGRAFCKTFWQMAVYPGSSNATVDCTLPYTTEYGLLSVGQRIFMQIIPVNQYGVKGVPSVSVVTVTGPSTAAVLTGSNDASGHLTWVYAPAKPTTWWIQSSSNPNNGFVNSANVPGATLLDTVPVGKYYRIIGVNAYGEYVTGISNVVHCA